LYNKVVRALVCVTDGVHTEGLVNCRSTHTPLPRAEDWIAWSLATESGAYQGAGG